MADAIARRGDHDVEGLAGAVAKHHVVAIERGDVARRPDAAGVDERKDLGVDHRMRLEQPVIGPRQAVPPGEADRAVDQSLADESPQPHRSPHLQEPLAAKIGRPAVDFAGHDEVAAAGRMHDRRRMLRTLHGDVRARVATADYDHPASGDRHGLRGRLVVGGVEVVARERTRDLGPAGHVVVAAGDHHAGVVSRRAVGERHAPALAGAAAGLDPLDRGVEMDVRGEGVPVGIGPQVVEALPMVGIRGVVARHRKVGELGK